MKLSCVCVLYENFRVYVCAFVLYTVKTDLLFGKNYVMSVTEE